VNVYAVVVYEWLEGAEPNGESQAVKIATGSISVRDPRYATAGRAASVKDALEESARLFRGMEDDADVPFVGVLRP
jgi:hypothetical protein